MDYPPGFEPVTPAKYAPGFEPVAAVDTSGGMPRGAADPGVLNPHEEPGFFAQLAKHLGPEILPMAGLFAGGSLGAASGVAGGPLAPATVPGAGIIGAGLGYATGKQANRGIESLFNYLTGKKPEDYGTLPQAIGTIGKDWATGSLIDATGGVINKGMSALGDLPAKSGLPGFGGSSAADLGVQAAAKRQGIPMPAAAATGSRGLAMVEATPGRFPLGANTAANFFDRTALGAQRAGERLAGTSLEEAPTAAIRSLEAAGQGVTRDVGAVAGAQDQAARDLIEQYLARFGSARETGPAGVGNLATGLGSEIQAGLDAAQQAARATVDPLFKAVQDEASAAGSGVPMTQTAQAAKDILAVEERMGALGRGKVAGPAATAAETAGPGAGGTPGPGYRPPGFENYPATMQEQIIRQYGLAEPAAVAPADAMELQKRLAAAVRTAPDDVTRRSLVQLRDAVGQDVTAWAAVSGTNVGPLRAQASQAYKEQIVPFFTERAPLRSKLMDVEPEQAARTLLGLGDPGLVKDAIAFLPVETQNRVRAAVFDSFRQLGPADFEKGVAKIGEDRLGALLGPEGMAHLQALRGQLRASFGREGVDPILGGIAAKPDQAGAAVVNALVRGQYKSPQQFDAVWSTLGPETRQGIGQGMLQDVLRQSIGPTNRFSTDRFMTQLSSKKIPTEIWQRVLSEDQAGALQDIERVFNRINDYAKGAANPSGTAQAGLSAWELKAAAALVFSGLAGLQDPAHVGAELAVLTAPWWGGKILFSRMAQGALMRPRVSGGTLAPLTKLLGLQLTPND